MLLLDLTIYLFVQGPGFVGVAYSTDPDFRVFQKKVMKKVITHNFKTLLHYSAIQLLQVHVTNIFIKGRLMAV